MKNKLFISQITASILLVIAMSSCDSCSKYFNTHKTDVADCATYNKQEANCVSSKSDGINCQYNKVSGICSKTVMDSATTNHKDHNENSDVKPHVAPQPATANTSPCSKLSMQDCIANAQCAYDASNNTCVPASAEVLKHQCARLLGTDACMTNKHCIWNAASKICEPK